MKQLLRLPLILFLLSPFFMDVAVQSQSTGPSAADKAKILC